MAVGMASPALADAGAGAYSSGSGGILSGNVVQAPIHVPVNVCGNSINVVGLFNPAIGNDCVNGSWSDDNGGPSFFDNDRPHFAGFQNGRDHYGRYPYGRDCLNPCRCEDECPPQPCPTTTCPCEDECPQPCPTTPCTPCEDECPQPCPPTPCDPCDPCEDDDN